MTHHLIDIEPVPKGKGVRFVNEPWLAESRGGTGEGVYCGAGEDPGWVCGVFSV